MDKKIAVPEGMLRAGMCAHNAAFMGDEGRVRDILESALRWLSDELQKMSKMANATKIGDDDYYGRAIDDVRRMFLAPEPEVPEAVRDMIWGNPDQWRVNGRTYDESILEAYKRGMAAQRGK